MGYRKANLKPIMTLRPLFCSRQEVCKHLNIPAIIHTDQKSLTYFPSSDPYEENYGHWVDQLRLLNPNIQYIPGPYDKVAGAMSRTLFYEEDCFTHMDVK